MKYLPLDLISLELISSSDTSSNRIFKVHDIYTTNRLKDKSALVATKYLNLKLLCEGENENEGEAETLIKLYFSAFSPNEIVDF